MISKKQLLKSLERIRKTLCAYIGPTCDCKYMQDEDQYICSGCEAGSGCPEIYTAINLIKSMSAAEYKQFSQGKKTIKNKPFSPLLDKKAMEKIADELTKSILKAFPQE